jgi:pyruvate, orthophosphate dikinase
MDLPGLLLCQFLSQLLASSLMASFLNVGINDQVCECLAQSPGGGGIKFALDLYQRFLRMFGCWILLAQERLYDDIVAVITAAEGVADPADLSEQGLRYLVEQFKGVVHVPQDPMRQFWMIVKGMLDSTRETRSAADPPRHSLLF